MLLCRAIVGSLIVGPVERGLGSIISLMGGLTPTTVSGTRVPLLLQGLDLMFQGANFVAELLNAGVYSRAPIVTVGVHVGFDVAPFLRRGFIDLLLDRGVELLSLFGNDLHFL